MTKFRMWLGLRHGRMQDIANILGVSKQYVDQASRAGKLDKFTKFIEEIEQAEMQDKETCRKIIVKCSEKLNSRTDGVRDYAFQELKRWVEIYEHQ